MIEPVAVLDVDAVVVALELIPVPVPVPVPVLLPVRAVIVFSCVVVVVVGIPRILGIAGVSGESNDGKGTRDVVGGGICVWDVGCIGVNNGVSCPCCA